MEIEFQKAELPCLTAVVNEIQNGEQTQELRLPDDMPDVGKVLCAWGQTILRGKEWRSDCLTVSGGMLMWVLYPRRTAAKTGLWMAGCPSSCVGSCREIPPRGRFG